MEADPLPLHLQENPTILRIFICRSLCRRNQPARAERNWKGWNCLFAAVPNLPTCSKKELNLPEIRTTILLLFYTKIWWLSSKTLSRGVPLTHFIKGTRFQEASPELRSSDVRPGRLDSKEAFLLPVTWGAQGDPTLGGFLFLSFL